ncbi:MAG TPA: hypothetical protein VH413_09915 [Verrucomicrobiae bacterium]|jgi:hypothetical protein|nr:hypothetical protein [Verrucomicrobiae bacterium]
MKAALKISLLLNAGLLGALFFALNRGQKLPPTAANEPSVPASSSLDSATPTTVVVTNLVEKPFRWSQLESSDYRVYIKNLRAIGCPEPTVCDLVTADVDSLFGEKSRGLEKKIADLANGPLSERLASEPALKAELLNLPQEQASLIASLLGIAPPANVVSIADAPVPVARARVAPQVAQPLSMPLVFADVDLSALHLDDARVQVINNLRQQFLDEVGANTNADPNDPAYLERWRKAQPEADQMLRGMIGINAYQAYDLAAHASWQHLASVAQ